MQERRSRQTAVAGAAEGEPDVAVLVPAAGSGTRMGEGTRKQYRELGGDPLLVCTLRVFDQCDAVGHIIVAAPAEDVRRVSDRLQEAGLRKLTAVVEGGASRQGSVRNALRAVPSSVNVVLVHDAVRPFIRAHHVSGVVDAVREHGAASLAVPVVDTLRRQEGKNFGATVDRDGLYRMQTPQGFRRDWLETAHREARTKDVPATDDVELVQRLGHSVRSVEGSAYNVKITTPTDWSLATAIWPRWCEGGMEGEAASSSQ
ncbi:2-C-methyl-D-erythritol 4-phosphate cytidylyltransferase [Longibacter salinarum]|uniref:2-C-methyl-D-erythritol 4-phosphate cytidylyltransferase n=2 Tax=Longibacter salinarum TaxID=1850348 RepID=A0A2A8CWH2_9BACT|nr:2-C-methyl-D-erythritol 4-phosphate cytidylyltransferase [Longibacter salinarum]